MGNTSHPRRQGFSRESEEAEDNSVLSSSSSAAAGAYLGIGSKPGGGRTGVASFSLDESRIRRRGLPRPKPPPTPPPAAPAFLEPGWSPPLPRPALLPAATAATAFPRPPTFPVLGGRPRGRFAGGAAAVSSGTSSIGSDFTIAELRRNMRKKTKREQGNAGDKEEGKLPSFITGAGDNVGDPTVTHDPTTYTWQQVQTMGLFSNYSWVHAQKPRR